MASEESDQTDAQADLSLLWRKCENVGNVVCVHACVHVCVCVLRKNNVIVLDV